MKEKFPVVESVWSSLIDRVVWIVTKLDIFNWKWTVDFISRLVFGDEGRVSFFQILKLTRKQTTHPVSIQRFHEISDKRMKVFSEVEMESRYKRDRGDTARPVITSRNFCFRPGKTRRYWKIKL